MQAGGRLSPARIEAPAQVGEAVSQRLFVAISAEQEFEVGSMSRFDDATERVACKRSLW